MVVGSVILLTLHGIVLYPNAGCFLILEIFRKIPTSGSKFFPWKKSGFAEVAKFLVLVKMSVRKRGPGKSHNSDFLS